MNYYIITGTSRGLGKALTEALLPRPDTTVIGIGRRATLEHPSYQHVPLDLADLSAVESNVPTFLRSLIEPASITLINNAGVLGEIGYLGEQSNDHLKLVFRVNTVAPAILMNAFISAFASLTVPRLILNISSGAAQRAVDGWAAYSASKAALDSLSRTAQKEQDLRASGIRIRSLSPGIIDTTMQAHIRAADPANFSEASQFAAYHAQGQLASPESVAARILAWLQRPGTISDEVVLHLRDLG
ncbi:SDR family NAD(P)-dependent oxidoreductase [Hymenobacter sp. BT175]|uniref:SDR family NAD(P)-dependent oxidoreductase n=1 Tax=Hymenobacter translucens TaxID=2886507 RepID=UPI001D0EEB3C|nr:SDR family NAD(P)-dependent oxidoreductase [Hymenobacter translucens]MCC2546994.1 SDR family NAD(P)-dependent oxidoreductase [Hymenobacter translucens]